MAQAARATGWSAERSGDPVALARVRHADGEVARLAGDLDAAVAAFTEARSLIQDRPDAPTPFAALVHASLARVTGSSELHEQAVTLARQSRDPAVQGAVLEGYAEWHAREGDVERAATLLGEAQALRGITSTADPEVRALAERVSELRRAAD